MKRLFTIVTVVVLTLAASGVMLAQDNPRIGTWKLNVAKSKFESGPPFKSDTRTVEPSGYGQKVTEDRVHADGSSQHYEYIANFDGKDYPITGQGPEGADTIAVKRIDANRTESTLKKDGKAVLMSRAVVSQDGKVLTLTGKGTDASGKPFNNVLVYDKQ